MPPAFGARLCRGEQPQQYPKTNRCQIFQPFQPCEAAATDPALRGTQPRSAIAPFAREKPIRPPCQASFYKKNRGNSILPEPPLPWPANLTQRRQDPKARRFPGLASPLLCALALVWSFTSSSPVRLGPILG